MLSAARKATALAVDLGLGAQFTISAGSEVLCGSASAASEWGMNMKGKNKKETYSFNGTGVFKAPLFGNKEGDGPGFGGLAVANGLRSRELFGK